MGLDHPETRIETGKDKLSAGFSSFLSSSDEVLN
jgi:hypothetical protein